MILTSINWDSLSKSDCLVYHLCISFLGGACYTRTKHMGCIWDSGAVLWICSRTCSYSWNSEVNPLITRIVLFIEDNIWHSLSFMRFDTLSSMGPYVLLRFLIKWWFFFVFSHFLVVDMDMRYKQFPSEL